MLVATAAPLRRATFGRNSARLTELMSVSGAARLYARSLAAQAEEAEAVEQSEASAYARGTARCSTRCAT